MPPWVKEEKIGTLLVASGSEMPVPIPNRTVCWQMFEPPQSLHPSVAVMLADARTPGPAVLADAPLAVMLADARAPAVFALAPDAVMQARWSPCAPCQRLRPERLLKTRGEAGR